MISTVINKARKLAKDLYVITEAESIHCYLIIGKEKAVLIDVGYGYENIQPIIESITDLPIMVMLTHGDPDHALGMGNFDEIYIHPLDLGKVYDSNTPDLKQKSVDYRVNKLPKIKEDLDVERFMKMDVTKTKVKFLYEGDKLDLGGLTLDVIHTPGHSYGHICLYDGKNKRLFSGDAVTHHNVWYFFSNDKNAPFDQARDIYRKLWENKDLYSEIYPAHGKTPVGNEILTELKEVFEWELAETYLKDQPFQSFMGDGYQHIYKNVHLIYSDERLGAFLGREILRNPL